MKPKYLEKLKAITSSGLLQLNGNRLLVEMLTEGEKTTASGIVFERDTTKAHMSVADRARVAVVLAVGSGYLTDEGEKVNLDYQPGDYVLVNQFGVKTFGDFFGLPEYKDGALGLITDDLIQGKISNFDVFEIVIKKP